MSFIYSITTEEGVQILITTKVDKLIEVVDKLAEDSKNLFDEEGYEDFDFERYNVKYFDNSLEKNREYIIESKLYFVRAIELDKEYYRYSYETALTYEQYLNFVKDPESFLVEWPKEQQLKKKEYDEKADIEHEKFMNTLEDSNNRETIDLGYMSIENGEWSNGTCYCSDEDLDNEKCKSCANPLDPNEIVIPFQEITIIYDYPFKKEFPIKHTVDNPNGFTRLEISEQIMVQYAEMYQEEDEDTGSSTGNIPGMLNRERSHGRYGIWGHSIGDLCLHSLYKSKNKDREYCIGVDS